MSGTRVTAESKAKRKAREAGNPYYRRVSELDAEELAARRARQAAYMREYISKNREEYNAKRRDYQRQRCRDARDAVLDALGGVCKECGWEDRRVLQIDHVEGGGSKQRAVHRKAGGTLSYYKALLQCLPELQLLCANCHMIKSYRSETEAQTGLIIAA